MFDPETNLTLDAIRRAGLMRDAEIARTLGEAATARRRRAVAATMRRLAERIDPGTAEQPLEGQPV